MKIELITTKKKLTAAIIKQMSQLSYSEFGEAVPLGYIFNIPKPGDYSILIQIGDAYRRLDARWERRGTYAGYNPPGKLGEFIKRIDPENIDGWFEKYDKLVQSGKERGQIYI